MTGAAQQESPREDATPGQPPQPPPSEPPVEPPAACPLQSAPKPEGPILVIEGTQHWAWVDPVAVRPLPNFGAWHRAMVGTTPEDQEFAALEAMVVVFGRETSIKPGMVFHLEVPGTPTRYLRFQIESKGEPTEAPKPLPDKEFVCLLLRATAGTAHPVAIKEKSVSSNEKMRGRFT